MADAVDRAQLLDEQLREDALRFRKAVPQQCETCGEDCAVLPNGARARFCGECLTAFLASRSCASGVCE